MTDPDAIGVYTPAHDQDQAEVRARTDIWRLGRLLDRGLVRRQDGEYEATHPITAREFQRAVASARRNHVNRLPRLNLAIKPKSAQRKRRRR